MNKFFSLIELLVIIAVISILMTLALPALAGARRQAEQKKCMVNLRSIGQTASLYSVDYDNYTIPANFGDTSNGSYGHFINYMISEMDCSHSIFKCPSMNEESMFDPAGHDPRSTNLYKTASYIMNIIHPGQWDGASIPEIAGAHGWGIDSTTPVNNGIVTYPAEKLFVMDAISGISNSHSGVNTFQRTDHGFLSSPPIGMVRWVGAHHNYRFNAVFGDGHSENIFVSDHVSWAVNR